MKESPRKSSLRISPFSKPLFECLRGCLQLKCATAVVHGMKYRKKEKYPQQQICDLQHLHVQGFHFLFSIVGLLICKWTGDCKLC